MKRAISKDGEKKKKKRSRTLKDTMLSRGLTGDGERELSEVAMKRAVSRDGDKKKKKKRSRTKDQRATMRSLGLTGDGNPIDGDSEQCSRCGEMKDYASDGIYLCMSCL